MCNVYKCKLLAVRSCHGEVGFCFIHILNSNERKKEVELFFEKYIKIFEVWLTLSTNEHRIKTRMRTKVFDMFVITLVTHTFSSANLTNILA